MVSSIQMEGSSNAPLTASARLEDIEYLYASNTNVSNFVSVKLSGKRRNYLLWKSQMLCLLDSHNMCGIVDATFVGPRHCSTDTMRQYDSLVKGWILGSVGEDVLADVYNLGSAKAVWDKLKSMYDPTTSLNQDSTATKWGSETEANGKDTIEIEVIGEKLSSTNTEIKGEDTEIIRKKEKKIENKKKLRKAVVKGDWVKAESILKEDMDLAKEAISSDGSTVLHIAVGTGHNDLVKKLFSYMKDEDLLTARRSDGCTALHIAAIVGNKYATDMLVDRNPDLLRMKDHKDKEPFHKAYENMHLDTIEFFLNALNDDSKSNSISLPFEGKIGVDLLVNAISAKQYNFASKLVKKHPNFASENDDVLMAITQNFPNGLNNLETLIYPSLDSFYWDLISLAAVYVLTSMIMVPGIIYVVFETREPSKRGFLLELIFAVLFAVPFMLLAVFSLAILLLVMVWSLFAVLYWLLWKGTKILFSTIKHIDNKKKEWDKAAKVLALVCDEIDKLHFSGTHHPYYNQPIIEASRQNAYEVVHEILFRSPEAIQSINKSGYDIIQLAIINRSENIYNLIYEIGECKSLYRTIEDSSKNNILHLAGRLAPSHELHKKRGAALQLQRELQWCEEVKKHVFPSYITRQNIFGETPDMVFTREHENLVKEGEKWMKTTAESCSITAALITTIVFAAAITVPGGSHQETGIPLFTKNGAFTVFAVSDAISLFASSTALLVFLSILTARFSENDFLVSLPRRLLIGLFSLLLSTISMMVAFSAILFLVFCHKKLWMLAPVCVLAFIPVGFIVNLQFPLIVDLFPVNIFSGLWQGKEKS